jgi:hypothetical protein
MERGFFFLPACRRRTTSSTTTPSPNTAKCRVLKQLVASRLRLV